MKIGVFGDSFADKFASKKYDLNTWYNYLETRHGHTVECFGESGSSILFSAILIEKHAKNFDLAIWCVTNTGRFSLLDQIDEKYIHVNAIGGTVDDIVVSGVVLNGSMPKKINHADINKKINVCSDYLKYIFDWDSENLIGKSIVSYLQNKHKNLMIVPCFRWPLEVEFNLYNVSEIESQHYFPGWSTVDIMKKYQDLRHGHLTAENHKVLSDLLQENLRPEIFQTSYDNFVAPIEPFEKVFVLR